MLWRTITSSVIAGIATTVSAQTAIEGERQAASPPQEIDILIPVVDGGTDPLAQQQCEDERDAGVLSGEIVVCRDRARGTTDGAWNRQRWERDYARESAYIDDPQAPNVAGLGIFRGPGLITGLCILNDCPPPPAILIDVEALPPPPEESDADRIARGLAPRGMDGERDQDYSEDELGLPPRPDWNENDPEPEGEPDSGPAPER